jgi:hypothetical protein
MIVVARSSHPRSGKLKITLKCLALAALMALSACQVTSVSTAQLEIHQAFINRSGLSPVELNQALRITCAPPRDWTPLPLTTNILYTHQQWRSPDHHVGMGVAYMHTPIPFSPQTLIWFAKAHYANANDGSGHLIGQWTDELGRCWFEAENDRFHIRGYAMTHGHDAWMVYSGYRIHAHPASTEILLAARGADSVAPVPGSE